VAKIRNEKNNFSSFPAVRMVQWLLCQGWDQSRYICIPTRGWALRDMGRKKGAQFTVPFTLLLCDLNLEPVKFILFPRYYCFYCLVYCWWFC
jgi:hypothetical protein